MEGTLKITTTTAKKLIKSIKHKYKKMKKNKNKFNDRRILLKKKN